MTSLPKACAAVAALSLLTSCGGGGNGGGGTVNHAFADLAVPTITAGSAFSFDLGMVSGGKYYVTDRNNKAVDVVDLVTLQLTQIKGTGANAFFGCAPTPNCVGANNGLSGPDGIDRITGTNTIYVGDVGSVKVVDSVSGTVTSTINVGSGSFRADEGCFDPDHHLYMISIPDADTTYVTFINTNTNTVVAKVQWIDTDGKPSGGNEACAYDSAQQSFLVNNDATIANPHGEMDVLPAASILAIPAGTTVGFLSVAGLKRFPLGNCDPTGLALGPGTDALVECRQGDVGAKLTSLIVNRTTGAIITTIPFGGGDQVAYDSRSNAYYVAGSRWHASGINELGGGCTATNLCTPTLFVIDASSRALTSTRDIGNNAHSVAVSPTGQVFLPYSSAASPAGCATCTINGFINGGISVFQF